jgi:replicative DNA helicase
MDKEMLELEQHGLGWAMLESDRIPVWSLDAFDVPAHKTILRHMKELHASGQPVDIITVAEALGAAGELDGVGGLQYLGQIVMAATPEIRGH